MKKALALLLAAVLMFSLAACGGKPGGTIGGQRRRSRFFPARFLQTVLLHSEKIRFFLQAARQRLAGGQHQHGR